MSEDISKAVERLTEYAEICARGRPFLADDPCPDLRLLLADHARLKAEVGRLSEALDDLVKAIICFSAHVPARYVEAARSALQPKPGEGK